MKELYMIACVDELGIHPIVAGTKEEMQRDLVAISQSIKEKRYKMYRLVDVMKDE